MNELCPAAEEVGALTSEPRCVCRFMVKAKGTAIPMERSACENYQRCTVWRYEKNRKVT